MLTSQDQLFFHPFKVPPLQLQNTRISLKATESLFGMISKAAYLDSTCSAAGGLLHYSRIREREWLTEEKARATAWMKGMRAFLSPLGDGPKSKTKAK